MGEEWGAAEPFPFFSDLDEELKKKVKQGRREELSRLPGFEADDAPDPTSESTFRSAKLRWDSGVRDETFGDYYRQLLSLRHERIVPLLANACGHSADYDANAPFVSVKWRFGPLILCLAANLSDKVVEATIPDKASSIFSIGDCGSGRLGPWAVIWSLSQAEVDG